MAVNKPSLRAKPEDKIFKLPQVHGNPWYNYYIPHDWLAVWTSAHNLWHHGNKFSETLGREIDTMANFFQACFESLM